MGSKYIITGVQLGLLEVLIENGEDVKAVRLLKEIEDKQFIGKTFDNKKVKK